MNDVSTTTNDTQPTQTSATPTQTDQKRAYERVMESIKQGAGVTVEDLQAAKEYAKETGQKRPRKPIMVAGQNKNKGKECSKRSCHEPATARTMCQKHYTQEYRKDPTRRAKANAASRKWAAKHRKPKGGGAQTA